jgi:hypothetical protein
MLSQLKKYRFDVDHKISKDQRFEDTQVINLQQQKEKSVRV